MIVKEGGGRGEVGEKEGGGRGEVGEKEGGDMGKGGEKELLLPTLVREYFLPEIGTISICRSH